MILGIPKTIRKLLLSEKEMLTGKDGQIIDDAKINEICEKFSRNREELTDDRLIFYDKILYWSARRDEIEASKDRSRKRKQLIQEKFHTKQLEENARKKRKA